MSDKKGIKLIKLVEPTATWTHKNITLNNILKRLEHFYESENTQIGNQKEINNWEKSSKAPSY